MQTPPRLVPLLAQFDFAWERLLARLDGLTDDEYRWEPVAGCWSIRPRDEARTARVFGAGPWVFEQDKAPPDPAPFTTIAWRMGHLAVSLAMRADYTIGTKALTWDAYQFHGGAGGGLAALAEAGTAWRAALTSADDAALDQVGRSQFP